MTRRSPRQSYNWRPRPTVIKMDVHGAEDKIVLACVIRSRRLSACCSRCIIFPICGASPGVTRTAMLDVLEDAALMLYYGAGHHAYPKEEFACDFQEPLAGSAYSYRKLERQARDLLLFAARTSSCSHSVTTISNHCSVRTFPQPMSRSCLAVAERTPSIEGWLQVPSGPRQNSARCPISSIAICPPQPLWARRLLPDRPQSRHPNLK